MRKFFNINGNYQFEWGDLGSLFTLINVIMVMTIGLSASWFGLVVAIINTIRTLAVDRKINLLITDLSMIGLNTYFLLLFYGFVG